jgi:hypothetical protein
MLSNYPAPRFPSSAEKKPSQKELYEAACKIVDKKSGRSGLGPIEPGDRILICLAPGGAPDDIEAIAEAMRNRGAKTVDIITEEQLQGTKEPIRSAEDGWWEIGIFPTHAGWTKFLEEMDVPQEIKKAHLEAKPPQVLVKEYLEKKPGYTKIFAGTAGRPTFREVLKDLFRNNFVYLTWKDIMNPANTYPDELYRAIERKVWQFLSQVERFVVTDPEGTHFEFEMDEGVADRLSRLDRDVGWVSGHMYLYPHHPLYKGGANGIVAGTAGHFGYFPKVKAYLTNGRVTKVEGGGKMGELWQDYLERYSKVHYPHFSEPGYYYMVEAALGTIVKARGRGNEIFATSAPYPNMAERERAGVVHFGLGVDPSEGLQELSSEMTRDIYRFAEEKDVPAVHSVHIHNLFITYEARLRGTRETAKLIDKGYLTVLGDRDIVDLASRCGDPKQLLTYDWIPAIPGINHPGSYEDYAKNPAAWIKEDMTRSRSTSRT